MSTIVYQKLQPSCNNNNDSYFIESKTLSLKLNSTNKNSVENFSSNSFYGAKTTNSNSNNCGGWSSIETLPSKKDVVAKEEAIYVHPIVKRSSFMLSEKSLQMCTESLGCETGTFDMESADNFFSSSTTTTKTTTKARIPPRQKFDIRKELSLGRGKFPPPLTTISGSSHICVRPHREDGRLVIEAVTTPIIQPYMQAERSDGRLRLSMLTGVSTDIDDDDDEDDDCNDNDGNEVEDFVENDEQGLEKEVEEDGGLEECNKSDANLFEDMDGISEKLGVKLGMGKIQRPSRCKERGQGKKRLINWEPFWVAT